MKMPLKKNCRVDFKKWNDKRYSVLVDFVNGVSLYSETGLKSINQLYGEFKYRVNQGLEVDNWAYPFYAEPFCKIDGANYSF